MSRELELRVAQVDSTVCFATGDPGNGAYPPVIWCTSTGAPNSFTGMTPSAGAKQPTSLLIDGTNGYYAGGNEVGKFGVSGTPVPGSIEANQSNARSLAQNGSILFWVRDGAIVKRAK